MTRMQNLAVWRIPESQSAQLAALAQRTMDLHVSIQDSVVWVTEGAHSFEINLECLWAPSRTGLPGR